MARNENERDPRARPPNDLPRVGVVVVNWQRRDVTLACLDALRRLDYPDWFLVLVDNGCRDFSPEEVGQLVPRGVYLHSEHNLGFAAGSNLGMRRAVGDGADYVWFLNNDAAPEAQALRELVAVAEGPPRSAIVGAKILQKRSPQRIDSVALRIGLVTGRITLLGHDEIDRGQYDSLVRAVAVTGCAMLATRQACERLGGFDEGFFAYLEDADFCLRARAAGLHVAIAPPARVLHDRQTARRGRQSSESLFLAARNHLILLERHGSGPSWWRPLRAVWIIGLNLLYAIRAADISSAMTRVSAVRQGVRAYRCRSAKS